MKKFFKAKQLIKSMVQNDYLPGIYKKAAAKGEVDPKKVIFADAHSNGLTEPTSLAATKGIIVIFFSSA